MKLYSKDDLDALLGVEPASTSDDQVFYVRVSSSTASTDGQEDRLARAYGSPVHVYRDHASGLREGRPGLKRLLDAAEDGKYTVVCITAKDRLTRFGYSYLERLLRTHGVTIKVLDDKQSKTPHEELLQDFMSLLASFSGKYYKLRSLKHEKMLLEEATSKVNAREESSDSPQEE